MSAGIININKGDDATLSFTFTNDDDSAFNLTNCTVFLTVKRSLSDTDVNAVLQKTWSSHTQPTQGKTAVALTHTDTTITDRAYFYDLQIVDALGQVTSSGPGSFVVSPEVTVRTS